MTEAHTSLIRQQEILQIPLIIAAAAFAYVLPFEGLFIAYAFLGPAHYLTQINWLHNRQYFIADKNAGKVYMRIAAVVLILLILFSPPPSPLLGAYVLAMMITAVFLLTDIAQKKIYFLLMGAAAAAVFLIQWKPWQILGAVLLPALIHVAVFTLLFLISGARKRKDKIGYISIATWVFALLLIAVLPPSVRVLWPETITEYLTLFKTSAKILGADQTTAATLDSTWSRAFGILTFCYTYHYLNWFSKTELLKWHKIENHRLFLIVGMYLGFLGIYAYDYMIGFWVLVFFATLHTVAEFPLDAIVIKELFNKRKS